MSEQKNKGSAGLFRLLLDLRNKFPVLWAVFENTKCSIVVKGDKESGGFVKFNEGEYTITLFNSDVKNPLNLFILAHEILHIYFNHFAIQRKYKELDNYAKDFAINNFLSSLGISPYTTKWLESQDCIHQASIKQMFGVTLDRQMNSARVYTELMKTESGKKSAKRQDSGEKLLLDLQGICKTDTSSMDQANIKEVQALAERLRGALSDKELETLAKAEEAVLGPEPSDKESKKSMGNFGLGIARELLRVPKPPSSKEITKILLQREVSIQGSISTPKRSSRRYQDQPGTIKPKQNRVCFVVDTSGSIGPYDLGVIKEVLLDVLKNFDVVVRCGDTALRSETKFKRGTKVISDSIFKGGGGTDLNFSKQKGDKFLHYLIFTDGYIPPFKEKFKRTLFLFQHSTPVSGETCHKIKYSAEDI